MTALLACTLSLLLFAAPEPSTSRPACPTAGCGQIVHTSIRPDAIEAGIFDAAADPIPDTAPAAVPVSMPPHASSAPYENPFSICNPLDVNGRVDSVFAIPAGCTAEAPTPTALTAPRAPTPAEQAAAAWVTVVLPPPDASLSPPRESFTQHTTELTITGPAATALNDMTAISTASLAIRAIPEAYRVTFGEGRNPRETSEHRVTYAYQRAGCYEVRIEVRWRGEYSVSGGPYQPIAGSAYTRQAFERPVNQLVGVLVDEHSAPPADETQPEDICRDPNNRPPRHDAWAWT